MQTFCIDADHSRTLQFKSNARQANVHSFLSLLLLVIKWVYLPVKTAINLKLIHHVPFYLMPFPNVKLIKSRFSNKPSFLFAKQTETHSLTVTHTHPHKEKHDETYSGCAHSIAVISHTSYASNL